MGEKHGVRSASVVSDALEEVRAQFARTTGGEVASYIPELARADPDHFGIGLVSVDGHDYGAGDVDVRFTLQSLSKPFVYALALVECGLEEVMRWVGAEPTGEGFNAISLEPGTGRPANAMINAGAIVATSLVPAANSAERFDRILGWLSTLAGRELGVDEAVYDSERDTGDRNRALTYLLRGAGGLPGDVDVVETYFRQCAIEVTTRDVAVMAATLANGGRAPSTGAQVIPPPVVTQVLAVMATCGMYDRSGEWLLRVGLPAKSGVSGGLLAVSPQRFGVGVYSPPLDEAGNSVRAVAALGTLAERFGLHMLQPVRRNGLDFAAAERLLHDLDLPGRRRVLDLRHVADADPVALRLLRAGLERLKSDGAEVAVVGSAGAGLPGRHFASVPEASNASDASKASDASG